MFRVDNVITKPTVSFLAKHGDVDLEFILTPMISKRNKEELEDPIQFSILNSYVKYKGKDYEDQLFQLIRKAHDDVLDTIYAQGLEPLPYHIVTPILDFMDLDDVFKYLKYEFKLKPPARLPEVFDEQIESDARGTRIQTYTKDDYLQLAALATILKVAMLPVFNYASIKQKDLSLVHREYILFYLFRYHKIYQSEPMQKLYGLVAKLIEQNTGSKDTESIRVLEKQVPKNELPFYVLAMVIIQKVSIATLVDDNSDKNIVTKIYNYVNNKLKSTGDVSRSIRNKTTLKDQDDTQESESLIESHRTTEKFDKGTLEELDWAVESVEKILNQMPEKQKANIDIKIVKDAEAFCKQFLYSDIQKIQTQLLAIIFKSIIDPRSIDYIKIEGIVNLITVGFAYLWSINCKVLALILISQIPPGTSDLEYIHSTVNKTRLSKELKEELDFFFPYKRVINAETTANIVEELINTMSQDIYSANWKPVCEDHYLVEGIGTDNYLQLVSSDVKYLLAEFIIKNERSIQSV